MKKKDILNLINANRVIENNRALLSTIENSMFSYTSYESEKYWYPTYPDLKEYFDILKLELLKAKEDTEESKKIIKKSTCNHEVRLEYHSLFSNTNKCVLCGKRISSDNTLSFKESTYRNKHTVTFVSKYQSDEDGEYIVKDGKTYEEVYELILSILTNFNDDDEVDLVNEFSKLNLPTAKINLEKRKQENYILIIGGSNIEYIDDEKTFYLTRKNEFDISDLVSYFYSLINTKVAVIDSKLPNTTESKKLLNDHTKVFFQDYTTLGYLDTALYQVEKIPFKLIIDASSLYNYKVSDNKIEYIPHTLDLLKKFPHSKIIQIRPINEKEIELIDIQQEKTAKETINDAYTHLKRLIKG